MRVAHFALAFAATALAAPVAVPDVAVSVGVQADLPDLTTLMTNFNVAMNSMEDDVVSAVNRLDPTVAATVSGVLGQMNVVMNTVDSALSGNESPAKLTKVMSSCNSMYSQVETLVTSMINSFSPSVATEVKEVMDSMGLVMNQVTAQVAQFVASENVTRDVAVKTGGLLGVVDDLVNTITGLLKNIEGLLNRIVKQVSPSLASTLKSTLGQVNGLVSKVNKVVDGTLKGVDINGVLSELDSTVNSLESTVTDIVKQVDPSLGKQLNGLLKKVVKTVAQVEKRVVKTA